MSYLNIIVDRNESTLAPKGKVELELSGFSIDEYLMDRLRDTIINTLREQGVGTVFLGDGVIELTMLNTLMLSESFFKDTYTDAYYKQVYEAMKEEYKELIEDNHKYMMVCEIVYIGDNLPYIRMGVDANSAKSGIFLRKDKDIIEIENRLAEVLLSIIPTIKCEDISAFVEYAFAFAFRNRRNARTNNGNRITKNYLSDSIKDIFKDNEETYNLFRDNLDTITDNLFKVVEECRKEFN
jgi:hypothetical protein